MRDLSPAAQAVLDASNLLPGKDSYQILAAALRASADQVVPYDEPSSFLPGAPQAFAIQRRTTRRQLLAIVAELDAKA